MTSGLEEIAVNHEQVERDPSWVPRQGRRLDGDDDVDLAPGVE